MIAPIILVLCAAFGAWQAWRRKGGALDILQYAAGYGFLGLIIGMALTIALDRAF